MSASYLFIFCLVIFQHMGWSQSSLNDVQKKEILHAHHVYRSEVGIEDMAWSDELSKKAMEWAKHLANKDLFEHSPIGFRNGMGENIWKGTHARFSLTDMVDAWGQEKEHYTYGKLKTPSRKKPTGHYTQIVWKKTTMLGCALATSASGFDILVCEYSPGGNMLGEYPY